VHRYKSCTHFQVRQAPPLWRSGGHAEEGPVELAFMVFMLKAAQVGAQLERCCEPQVVLWQRVTSSCSRKVPKLERGPAVILNVTIGRTSPPYTCGGGDG